MKNWRKQNPLILHDMAREISMLRKNYIPTLTDLGKNIMTLKTIQEQFSKDVSILTFESPLSKSIREANLCMSKTFASFKPLPSIITQIQKDRKKWVESLGTSVGALSQAKEIGCALTKNVSLIVNSSLLTQQTIARFDLKTIGESFNVGLNSRLALSKSITEMVNAYRGFWNTFNINPQKFFSIPSTATQIPSNEMNIATYQAELSRNEPAVFPEEEEFIKTIEPDDLNMKQTLALFDPELISLYEGAIAALISKSPDRIRHFSISLRELLTQTLHMLAPDEKFFRWNINKSLIDEKGRPKRAGRMLYICRNINYDLFSKFIDCDISVVLAFLNLFQEGTHAIKASFTEKQLKAMLIRTKCLIMYLIEISRNT